MQNLSNNNFKNKLYKLLKRDSRLWDKEKKELNETLLKDLTDKLDEQLLNLLLSDKQAKEKFFLKIKDLFVFKINEFKFFIDENKLDNSYTQYKNRIGLKAGSKLLSERDEVVLDWPFKDCVLEGGMTKEGQKRNEIFFNEVLAQDEIDRLYDPKVFTNWTRYTKNGVKKVKELERDAEGIIKENLIIKGNNLLALHSLKSQFAGKVKLIYIDPPYNLGKNDFGYNDNFNHSTWLTFMRNRLEIANDLLKKEGAIIISCDDSEQAYLKVLMDEVFQKTNFLVNGVVNRTSEIASNYVISKHEYFLIYAKEFNAFKLEGKDRYTVSRGTVGNEDQTMPMITFPAGLKCNGVTDGTYKETKKLKDSKENIKNLDPIIVKNGRLQKGVRLKARWRSSNDMRNFFDNNCNPTVAKINGVIEEIYFEGERFMPQIRKKITEKIPSLILDNKRGSKDLEKLHLAGSFKYPKSKDYISKLISYIVAKNDLVMDFCAGSGTTSHAVLDLNGKDGGNRKFILVEQLDKHVDVIVERIFRVIRSNGKDNFVYLELAKWNEEAKEKILKAENFKELIILFDELYNKYFLNYTVKVKDFREKVIQEGEFKNLPLKKQKTLFVEMLDMNQLYVNYSEREDKKYGLSKNDITLTEKFYNQE